MVPAASACERRLGIYCILSWLLKHICWALQGRAFLGPEGSGLCLSPGQPHKAIPTQRCHTRKPPFSVGPLSPVCTGSPLRPRPAGLGAKGTGSGGPCLKSGPLLDAGPHWCHRPAGHRSLGVAIIRAAARDCGWLGASPALLQPIPPQVAPHLPEGALRMSEGQVLVWVCLEAGRTYRLPPGCVFSFHNICCLGVRSHR